MSIPYDYERDDGSRRIRVRVHRKLDLTDYLAIIDRQAYDGTWQFSMLYDLRLVAAPMAREDADLVAAHLYRKLIGLGPRGPVAIVATSPDIVGAAQLYAFNTARAGVTVEIFWGIADAEAWLDGMPAPKPET